MRYTEEQCEIIESNEKSLVVNAFAGTGKTSTLVGYAEKRPTRSFTYIAFNRSVADEAKRKFPRNVRCVTTHGLAYREFGVPYQHKLGNNRPFQIQKFLREKEITVCGNVIQTINNFLSSNATELDERHLSFADTGQQGGDILNYSRKVWGAMCDTSNTEIMMPHDGYLKLYEQSNPFIGTESILFDESQDANPVTLSIVMAQDHCQRVFVGDRHQAIYGFRGAVNAMSKIERTKQLQLTTSFRFGDGIARAATQVLGEFTSCKSRIHGRGSHETVFSVNQDAPHAILARTNGELFGQAVRTMSRGRPFGFLGGIKGYKLEMILDAWNLCAGKKGMIRDPLLRAFQTFSDLKNYAEALDDKEAKSLIRIVDTYRSSIPRLVEQIKLKAVETLTGQEVVLATAHKAKGSEWLDVVLADDFIDLAEAEEKRQLGKGSPKVEEINILYVAMTRALRGLALPVNTTLWLQANRKKLAEIQHPF